MVRYRKKWDQGIYHSAEEPFSHLSKGIDWYFYYLFLSILHAIELNPLIAILASFNFLTNPLYQISSFAIITMKFVALISGGKDSCFTISHCLAQGHELVALANLYPCVDSEIDSFMYQTVGYNIIENYSQCIGVPIYRRKITGTSKNTEMQYKITLDDETEDLFELLSTVKHHHPDIQAVSVGAILSNYQRIRVEHVCQRLNLTSLAFLWQSDQNELMQQMVNVSGMNAVIIKVATYGLDASHLGMTINELYPKLVELNKSFDVHICGEGGEFETIVLDAPFFLKKYMKISRKEIITHSNDVFYLKIDIELIDKLETMHKSLHDFDISHWKQFIIEPFCLHDNFQKLYDNIQIRSKENDPTDFGNENCYDLVNVENIDTNKVITLDSKVFEINDKLYISNLKARNIESEVEDQTKDILNQLLVILEDHHLDAENIISTSLLVKSMDNFVKINQVYYQHFDKSLPPARTCIETSLASGLSVSFIASKISKNGLHVQSRSYWAPSNIGPYSQAIKINLIANLSGQIPLIAKNMTLQFDDLKLNTLLSYQHLSCVMEVINCVNLMLVVCYFSDVRYLKLVVKFWKELHNECAPRKKLIIVQVNNMPKNAPIEWNAITYNDSSSSMLYEDDEEQEQELMSDTKGNVLLTMLKFQASTVKKNGEFVTVCYIGSGQELENLIYEYKDCHFIVYSKHDYLIIKILIKASSLEFVPVNHVFDSDGNEVKFGAIIRGYLK